MGAAYFYHLTRNPVAATLAMLAEKSLAAGWRVEVRGRAHALLEGIDVSLWQREGFLPHGIAGGPHDADQPILLTTAPTCAEGTACLMAIDGVDVSAEEVAALSRVCILFDGHSEEAVARARVQWKALTDAGVSAQYWSEADGRWEKKAEANAP